VVELWSDGRQKVSGVSVQVSGRINWSGGVMEYWSGGVMEFWPPARRAYGSERMMEGRRFPRLRFASDGIVDRCQCSGFRTDGGVRCQDG
jgi:hypothetical protein